MNYDWTQSLCFAIIQKPMEKSYWLFVEGTVDPPTEWRHISSTLFSETADAKVTASITRASLCVCSRGVATGVPGCAGATHSGSWHT